jgi:hypothetical protein
MGRATAAAHYRGTMSSVRYRCTACGNLTRFDVVAERKTRSFHHYSVGGELDIEEVEVLSENISEVACRWCGHGHAVEVIDELPATPDNVPEEAKVTPS